MNRFMIVDDNEPDQFLSKYIVEQFAPTAEILQAYDGLEALEILDTLDQQPDIILLDINMPRMNGHEFLEEYDQRENNGSVVVMLTSSALGVDKDRALSFGCVKKYLTKPLNEEALSSLSDLLTPTP